MTATLFFVVLLSLTCGWLAGVTLVSAFLPRRAPLTGTDLHKRSADLTDRAAKG